jgi:peptidoglycan DL-endopeptidase CwlO
MLMMVLPASGAPPSITAKQREAGAIISELNSLDSDLNRAVEAYDGARLHLTQTQRAIKTNTYVLRVAKHNYKRAQQNIAERLRALYMNGEGQSTIEIILGARSLDDVISGLDTAERVSAQDEEIAREAATFRSQIATRQKRLIADRKRASELVAEAQSRRTTIEGSIAKRQRLLASVKDEIARMQAAEQKRQLLIAAQVRARLSAQAKAQAAVSHVAPASADSTGAPPTTSEQTGSPVTTPVSAPAPPSRYGGVVAIAMRYLGVPYKWGGSSPDTGFDCSGFTMYVYAQIGVSLPHYTGDQWQMGTAVSREDLQPGDLVFFDGLGHEGLYIGNNQFIHAPHTGDVVKISSISGWYAETYMGARRL